MLLVWKVMANPRQHIEKRARATVYGRTSVGVALGGPAKPQELEPAILVSPGLFGFGALCGEGSLLRGLTLLPH